MTGLGAAWVTVNDVFGPLPATEGTTKAYQEDDQDLAKWRREKESHRGYREWSVGAKLFLPNSEWNNMWSKIIPAQIGIG